MLINTLLSIHEEPRSSIMNFTASGKFVGIESLVDPEGFSSFEMVVPFTSASDLLRPNILSKILINLVFRS